MTGISWIYLQVVSPVNIIESWVIRIYKHFPDPLEMCE